MSRVIQTELQQAQFHLLHYYSHIEQKLRSWYPGANWRDEEIAWLKEEQKRRNEVERAFLTLLGSVCHQVRNPADANRK